MARKYDAVTLKSVRDVEALRVTLIHCLDMLRGVQEKANAIPDVWPGRWLDNGVNHLEQALARVVELESKR